MALKLEVFSLEREVLSRIIQDIDLYTSAKFRAFNTNLNNYACFLHHRDFLGSTTLLHFFKVMM